ncbi:MAG TPA: gamma-glutamyl-gamma-aminobutyrate hydrolase family protein [Bryobacteraceae bacterium]|jgi:putative glutamine amidotransferase|nr:gamma-glutamyl-gamma-aminobutyrate hydrolase family protein [Bryobacteraceae bacterium]
MTRVLVPYNEFRSVAPYLEAAQAAGAEPVAVLAHGSVKLDDYAGLLLMGGVDVNPARYGEAAAPETEKPDDERDRVEMDLIHQAIDRDLPVLAICRGQQILNVYHGGTLIQHLPAASHHVRRTPRNPGSPAHEVEVVPGTLLSSLVTDAKLQVNSRHHQAVGRLGEHLRISARDTEDRVVEALERPDRTFMLAVQWHPENQAAKFPDQMALFRAFVNAASLYTGR